MRSEIIFAAVFIAAAVVSVRILDLREGAGAQAHLQVAPVQTDQGLQAASLSVGVGDEVRIAASPDRQFYVDADINQRTAHFLIDTGATYVALRDSDAREAGIYTSWTDYKYPVHTANGETKAAFVTIDEIEIDGLRIEGVKAFVLHDDQLKINLLGMSYLSRLESVEARNGELLLRG